MHLTDQALAQADDAIATMRDAARHARALHARAELLRHMRGTAAKPGADEATVAREWMHAWGLQDWPEVASEMQRFTAAFCRYAAERSDEADHAVRDATASLEHALVQRGTTLADQMAWRSHCAHGWWAAVSPPPPEYATRPGVPGPAQPFWDSGCAPRCRGE